jgi:hypothetical protein
VAKLVADLRDAGRSDVGDIVDDHRQSWAILGRSWLIFNAEEIGLSPAIVRVGRRVYIDVDAFNVWLKERRGCPPSRRL